MVKKQKKIRGFPTDWKKMAYHKCGDLITDIPVNDIGFLTDFTKYCPKCGTRYKNADLEVFVGRFISLAKWYNPFTWFDVMLEISSDYRRVAQA